MFILFSYYFHITFGCGCGNLPNSMTEFHLGSSGAILVKSRKLCYFAPSKWRNEMWRSPFCCSCLLAANGTAESRSTSESIRSRSSGTVQWISMVHVSQQDSLHGVTQYQFCGRFDVPSNNISSTFGIPVFPTISFLYSQEYPSLKIVIGCYWIDRTTSLYLYLSI